jgi:ABC-type glycerol-3-phosphate transport system permease component
MAVLTSTHGRRQGRIGEAKSDHAFQAINICLLALFTLAVLYPLIYVFSSSFSSDEAINSGAVKTVAGRLGDEGSRRALGELDGVLIGGA